MTQLHYALGLRNGYNYKWHFDFPWNVVSLKVWFWKSWLDLGQRMGDNAPVSHRGARLLGVRRDEYVVHSNR